MVAGVDNLLKLLESYKLKQVPRNSSNHYLDEKDGVSYSRRETTAEHVFSSMRLAYYFLSTEVEFSSLDKPHVYDLLLHHDDCEILARDMGISERERRETKELREKAAVQALSKRYPAGLDAALLAFDAEYRAKATAEARFASAIDKMDALVHELQYPRDWGPKGFDEHNVRAWFSPAFAYSPTFSRYFEDMVVFLRTNGYFDA